MNEKALAKLMKAAYKGGGVKVFRSPEDVLYLAGPGWACAMLWAYAPGPVLGQIAAWLHGLPEKGECWWCLDDAKDDPQPIDSMPEPLPALSAAPPEEGGQLLLLALTRNRFLAAQRDDHKVVWFEQQAVDLLGRLATLGGGALLAGPDGMPWGRWYDPETGTVVFLETVDRVRPDLTAKLGEIDFRNRGGAGNGETQ